MNDNLLPVVEEVLAKPSEKRNTDDHRTVKNWLHEDSQLKELLKFTVLKLGKPRTNEDAEKAWKSFSKRRLTQVIKNYDPTRTYYTKKKEVKEQEEKKKKKDHVANFLGYLNFRITDFCWDLVNVLSEDISLIFDKPGRDWSEDERGCVGQWLNSDPHEHLAEKVAQNLKELSVEPPNDADWDALLTSWQLRAIENYDPYDPERKGNLCFLNYRSSLLGDYCWELANAPQEIRQIFDKSGINWLTDETLLVKVWSGIAAAGDQIHPEETKEILTRSGDAQRETLEKIAKNIPGQHTADEVLNAFIANNEFSKVQKKYDPTKTNSRRFWTYLQVCFRNFRPKMNRVADVSTSLSAVDYLLEDPGLSPEEKAIRKDLIEKINKLRKAMSPREREAFAARFDSNFDKSFKEIAQELGKKTATVRKDYHDAIEMLREGLLRKVEEKVELPEDKKVDSV